MSTVKDTLTATYFGEFECKVSRRFKEIAKKQGLSQSFVLKTIIKQYLEKINR